MLSDAKQVQAGMRVPPKSLTVGVCFDTRDDFKFTSDQPEDWDAEFAVSVAVDDIVHALEDLEHEVHMIGSGRKLLDNFHQVERTVDIVFNIAEGYFGRAREAQIPAMLEMAGIPYIGSDAYTLSMALNKWHTKVLALHYGIGTPGFTVVRSRDELERIGQVRFPVIPKLCYEGSSKGLNDDAVVRDYAELRRSVEYLLRLYKQPVIVEEFIEGKEVDVPIIGNSPEKAFGVVGITLDDTLELNERFLTSKIVREDGYGFRYPLTEPYVEETERNALLLYNLLECRDFGRVDMRIDREGRPLLLEINPYPFLGKHSSFSEVAERSGVGYTNMIGMILDSALSRQTLRQRIQAKLYASDA